MNRAVLIAIVLVAAPLMAVFATPAAAQSTAPVLKVNGSEIVSPAGPGPCDPTAFEVLCFEVTEGDPATAFVAGATATVELTATGEAPHNLFVTLEENADARALPDGTPTDAAIGNSETVQAGESTTLTFTVPSTGTLYFWCDVGPDNHELLGMNFTAAIQPAPEVEEETDDDNTTDDNETDEAPDNSTAPEPSPTPTPTETMAPEPTNNTTAANEDDDAEVETSESPAPLFVSALALLVPLALLRRRR